MATGYHSGDGGSIQPENSYSFSNGVGTSGESWRLGSVGAMRDGGITLRTGKSGYFCQVTVTPLAFYYRPK